MFYGEKINYGDIIATEFNSFFTSIEPALADKITCSVDPISYVDTTINSIVISYVSYMDVKNTILSLKNSSPRSIITLVDKITSSLDSGDLIIGVFLDLKKAFDTVNHHILLKKHFCYGIRGCTLKWFESYLTDRSQFVNYDGTQSEINSVKCGVPQGSILGPLFIIYMNDIFNVSEFLFNILYADDTCVLMNSKHLEDLVTRMQKQLNLLYTWLQVNKLSLFRQKTYYIIFQLELN